MKAQLVFFIGIIIKGNITLLFLLLLCLSNKITAQQHFLTDLQRLSYIDKAQSMRMVEDYKGALLFIDSVLEVNPVDAQVLLFKGDVLMQDNNFRKAATTLEQLLYLDYNNTVARVNLSYALFKCHKPKKALHQAREAWLIDTTNKNAIVNYFNALLWNQKTNEARTFLEKNKQYLDDEHPLVLGARLAMTRGDFNEAIKIYDSLSKTTKNKYYIQECAEVLLGKKLINKSMATMMANRVHFTENEWLTYVNKYKGSTSHRMGTTSVYFKDIAKNIRQEASVYWEQGGSNTIRFGTRVGVGKLSIDGDEVSKFSYGQISAKQRWNTNWSGETELTLQNIKGNEAHATQTITGGQSLTYQAHDRRMFTVYYNAEVLNYTSLILQDNIRAHNIGAKTNLLFTARSGFYGQGSRAFISDGNRRTQLFGSLYHLFRTEPIFKIGWNNSYLHFSDNSITNYFSPEQYLSTEIFSEFQLAKPEWKNLFLNTQAALGLQQINNSVWETGYRFQAEVGFNRKRSDIGLLYRKSNVAFNSGTGYKFDWFTLHFAYKWN